MRTKQILLRLFVALLFLIPLVCVMYVVFVVRVEQYEYNSLPNATWVNSSSSSQYSTPGLPSFKMIGSTYSTPEISLSDTSSLIPNTKNISSTVRRILCPLSCVNVDVPNGCRC